jgi:hypothetical protein
MLFISPHVDITVASYCIFRGSNSLLAAMLKTQYSEGAGKKDVKTVV